jgi:hypothetical protein
MAYHKWEHQQHGIEMCTKCGLHKAYYLEPMWKGKNTVEFSDREGGIVAVSSQKSVVPPCEAGAYDS